MHRQGLLGNITKPWVKISAALFCAFLWGCGFPLIKSGYAALGIGSDDTFSHILYAGLRFFFSGVILFLISVSSKRKGEADTFSFRWMPGILLLSLVQTFLQYLFQYIGLANLAGGTSSMLAQTNVFLLVFLSPLFFKDDRLSIGRALGSIVGFAGIFVLNFKSGLDLTFAPMGEGLILMSSLMAAFGFIIGKRVMMSKSVALITGIQQTIGGAALIIIGLLGNGGFTKVTVSGIGILLFLIASAVGANFIWNLLLKYNPISDVSIFKFAVPVFGLVFSGILLGEKIFTLRNITALVLICAGIILVNMRRNTNESNH